MISLGVLKGVASSLERMLGCDELPMAIEDHLVFARAHILEAGLEAQDGTGRSATRLQDDLWEERRRAAVVVAASGPRPGLPLHGRPE